MTDIPHDTSGTVAHIGGTTDAKATPTKKSGASLAEVRARMMSMGSLTPEPEKKSEQNITMVEQRIKPMNERVIPAAPIQNSVSSSLPHNSDISPETRAELEELAALVTPQKATATPIKQEEDPASIPTPQQPVPQREPMAHHESPIAHGVSAPVYVPPTATTTAIKTEPPKQTSDRPQPGVAHQTWGNSGNPGVSMTGKPLAPPQLKTTVVPPMSAVKETGPSLEEPALQEAPQVLRKKISSSPLVQAIRTFRTDAMQAVDKNKISMVGAIAAEEERRILEKKKHVESRVSASVSPGAFYLLGIATTLIVLGGITFAAVRYLARSAAIPTEVALASPIFVEAQKKISLDNLRRSEVMQALVIARDEAHVTVGAITGLYPTMRSDTAGGTAPQGERLATTEEFFFAIDTHIPGALTRALAPHFLLGIHEFSKNEPFLLIPVTDYDNAYAGVLEWEADMRNDLAPLFGPAFVEFYRAPSALTYRDIIKESATTSTSTGAVRSSPELASSTTPLTLPSTATTSDALQIRGFEDARFRNKEVRVLRREDGTIAILYSFLSRDMLLVTTNEFTLKEVLTRLTSKRF